jgi:hypothetical protein
MPDAFLSPYSCLRHQLCRTVATGEPPTGLHEPVWAMGHASTVKPQTEVWPTVHCLSISKFVYSFKFQEIHLNLKIRRNHIKLIKMPTKFHQNPLDQISTVSLIKYVFLHYCLVNFLKKSNLEVINYKNP